MSNKILIWAIVVTVCMVVFLGIRSVSGPSLDEVGSGPIRIGALLPLTGAAATYGESENRAIEVAIKEINDAGGIRGRKLELVLEDGKCDLRAAEIATQKLVQIDKVKFIIGGACSSETLAAAKISEPANVLLISPSASSPSISSAGNFVFRIYSSGAITGRIAATYAYNELGVRRAAVIAEETDDAQGTQEIFQNTFKELGGAVVAAESYISDEIDFRTPILKIKAENPDMIYFVPQTFSPGLEIIKQLRENKITVPYITTEILLDRMVIKDNESSLEGVFGVELPIDYEGNAKAKVLRDAHKEMFDDEEPGIFATYAYDAVYLLKEGIEKVGSANTDMLRDWFYSIKNWQGASGLLTIDRYGDVIAEPLMRQIKKGEVVDVEKSIQQ